MSLTYPIAFHPKTPATQRLTINRRQSVTESPYSYRVQVVDTASQWALEWTWPRMRHADAEAVAAWLLSLKGQVGSFRYAPRQSVVSALTGRTLSQQAYGYNDTVAITGWGSGAPSGLRAGQYAQIGDQLLRITSANLQADSNGIVIVSFEPQLRSNFAAGTAVNFATPTGIFRMNASEGIGYTLDPDRLPEFGNLTAREVI